MVTTLQQSALSGIYHICACMFACVHVCVHACRCACFCRCVRSRV